MYSRTFSHITAQALVPEQLISYVTAVGESQPLLCGECVAFDYEGHRALIAYAPGSLPDECPESSAHAMNEAVTAALDSGSCSTLTVLGPAKPSAAPDTAACREDAYAFLSLPMDSPGQNLRNMLRRGSRECAVTEEAWGEEHATLTASYRESRPLEAGTRHIYGRIPKYLAATPGAVIFAARDSTSRLLAFTIGDFSSLSTAFYMFAFRLPDCPPGVADTLLNALATRATEQGHQYLNLGLGINKGIAAFKHKWGATFHLPCVQTAWNMAEQPKPERVKGMCPQKKTPTASGSARGQQANQETDVTANPLAVFTPPGFSGNFRRFLLGDKRPFDCLQVEVTSQCPGKCTYCPHTTKGSVWRSRRMEDTTFAALEPLIRKAKRVHLQGWGEPLLHPRFFDYAAAAVRVGSAVSTTTYGLTITDSVADTLVASGIDIVAFSLTGVDEASNHARVNVPFEKVREGILALNRAKKRTGGDWPRIHLAYLMLAPEIENAEKLPELMENLDVPVAVVSTLDYIAAPGMETQAYAPHETEKIERARVLLHGAAEKAAATGRTIHYSLPGEHGRNDCNERIQSCMYIDAEGNIAPCIYVNLPTDEEDPCRRVFGCALHTNPLAIWNSAEYVRFRQRLAKGEADQPCVSCAKRFERLY